MEEKDLIKKFIEESYLLKTAISEQNLINAKKCYEELYVIYQQINESKLEQIHKEVAYHQLLNSYHAITDLKQQITAPTNIIAIALVIIILSVIIFINPRMIGLAVFQEKINQPFNIEFTQTGSKQIELKSIPTSLTITGQFKGGGSAKLFAEVEGRRLLLFDSTKSKINGEKFIQQCIDTCILPKISTTKMVLSAEIDGADLTISSVQYNTRTNNNSPVWNGEPKTITINGKTTINLSQYFKDINDNELVYLAIAPEGIQTEISGSMLTIIPNTTTKGQKPLDLIASNMKQQIRARIMLDAQ